MPKTGSGLHEAQPAASAAGGAKIAAGTLPEAEDVPDSTACSVGWWLVAGAGLF
jgi:hypothetical protein